MILSYTSRDGARAHTVDTDTLPESSLHALLRKGLAHYIGNECASEVTALKKKAEASGEEWSDAIAAENLARVQAEAMAELLEGTVGVRKPSAPKPPARDTLEGRMWKLAADKVAALLKAKGHVFPKAKKGEPAPTLAFPTGNGTSSVLWTFDDLVKRRLNPETFPADVAEFRKIAIADMKAEERAAAKAAELAAATAGEELF